jgi:uncharacterized membrane protein
MLGQAEGLTIGHWELARNVSEWIEILAVVVIASSVVIALVLGARAALAADAVAGVEAVKRQIGRGLLLGLDLLIAGDIIRTVTLEPTLENVAALGLLVVVRTFLSWSLVVELEGRWPWQLDRKRRRESVSSPDSHSSRPDELLS